jgi:hypothetical protein
MALGKRRLGRGHGSDFAVAGFAAEAFLLFHGDRRAGICLRMRFRTVEEGRTGQIQRERGMNGLSYGHGNELPCGEALGGGRYAGKLNVQGIGVPERVGAALQPDVKPVRVGEIAFVLDDLAKDMVGAQIEIRWEGGGSVVVGAVTAFI